MRLTVLYIGFIIVTYSLTEACKKAFPAPHIKEADKNSGKG